MLAVGASGVQARVREPARRHRRVLRRSPRRSSARSSNLYIDRLSTRLRERRLELGVTPDARAWLAERGYDPLYGARPLRRLMQHEIDDQLARALLAGEIRDGDTVMVDLAPDGETLTGLASGGRDRCGSATTSDRRVDESHRRRAARRVRSVRGVSRRPRRARRTPFALAGMRRSSAKRQHADAEAAERP